MRAICQVICDPKEIHYERAGYRGEAGLGFRHRVGRALFDAGSPGHASVGVLGHGGTRLAIG
jgi:hypothetical protein